MFVSRIFVFFTLTIVFSCISSIHGWLFYKKSYYPYATREYNTNSAASGQSQQHQSQANPHHPVGVAPGNSWSPMASGSGVYYNEGIPGGVPMAMAVPVAIPVLKDGIPTGMYVNPHGSIQDVPLYSQPGSSARPQGLPVVNHQSQDLKYAYGPCMCPVAYTTRVEAVETPAPEPQTTHPATPTRETYVVQPAGTTTS